MSRDGRPKEPLLGQAAESSYTTGGVEHQESLSSPSHGLGINPLDSQVSVDLASGTDSALKQGSPRKGAYLSFENVKLAIADSNAKHEDETGAVSNQKYILNGISGEAFPGQLLGIIGASGGGKTTLLSLISGRLFKIESLASNSTSSGEIFLNRTRVDCSRSNDFEFLRQSMGFVLQEDILFETETAGEAVSVSAQLRLNNKINGELLTKEQKLARADQVLKELDLWNSRNTKIGGQTIRGLSGGERKRVSIGVELVTDPNILLLDEPTSGLDSAIAFQTMQLLKNLAQQGKTVVASLHQPSSEIFGLLDKVMILARGRVVYNGFVNDLAAYLRDYTGYECPQYSNIADFVLQQVHEQPEYFITKWDEYMAARNETTFIPNESASKSQQLSVAKVYRKSSRDYTQQIEVSQMAPFCSQVGVLLKRQTLIFLRNPIPTFVRNGQALFTAVLQGILWWRMKALTDYNEDDRNDPDLQSNIYNRFGGIFYAVVFSVMNAVMTANLTFPLQRSVFQKERASNWYYTVPYLIGKTLIDLPLAWITMLPFVLIIKYMCNFYTPWYKMYVILGVTASVADSMGFCLGCLASRPDIAVQLTPLTVIPLMLFSGFFISINDIPVWIQWIRWLDCFYYACELFCVYEFNGQGEAADEFLEVKGLEPKHEWRDWYALIILMVAVRVIGILYLVYKNGL